MFPKVVSRCSSVVNENIISLPRRLFTSKHLFRTPNLSKQVTVKCFFFYLYFLAAPQHCKCIFPVEDSENLGRD